MDEAVEALQKLTEVLEKTQEVLKYHNKLILELYERVSELEKNAS